MKLSLHAPLRRKERGSMSVEFALILPAFFMVLYAVITYGLIFAAQQNLTLAATEGARAALNYQVSSTPQAALTARATAACTAATNLAGWLTGVTCTSTPAGNCSYDTSMYCIKVTLTYPYNTSPLIAPLPLVGMLLPVPDSLTGTATVQISPVNII
ncbi:TadE/TadG family type IV pilus assembly protein [Burkholderia plantarii]|uniref:TadE/TadG family type IV pilus assembly protein n=1 Tax=Burkholderia plantarii TaxID=41899 RepID=UPI0018DD5061|nr:TadE family protein [Burkholderia plantarii]MBI0328830.1 pilus assembly protein [Burkholderia plantarii]